MRSIFHTLLTAMILTLFIAPFGYSFIVTPFHRFHSPSRLMHSFVQTPKSFVNYGPRRSISLFSSDKNEGESNEKEDVVFATDPKKVEEPTLSDNDRTLIKQIYEMSSKGNDANSLEVQLMQALPSMSPGLVMALRRVGNGGSMIDNTSDEEQEHLKVLGTALEQVVNAKMEKAKDLLGSFLDCGEIRKLDTAIGKAVKQDQLDMAFFTVLNMNVKDAYEDAQQNTAVATTTGENEGEEENVTANRLSILQHIYTRCQEEVEKKVDPGIALLNKLLRTSIDSIRYNQLQHYLGKPKTTITSPDGKEIQLPVAPDQKSLVPIEKFVEALSNAVRQIRQVEQAGGTDRTTAANLVENCRQVAIEARSVIAQEYGKESGELKDFEESLQPIFRPTSNPSQ